MTAGTQILCSQVKEEPCTPPQVAPAAPVGIIIINLLVSILWIRACSCRKFGKQK